ncbi:hypothetical protein LguiB_028188 [Lonicera macranthoides]
MPQFHPAVSPGLEWGVVQGLSSPSRSFGDNPRNVSGADGPIYDHCRTTLSGGPAHVIFWFDMDVFWLRGSKVDTREKINTQSSHDSISEHINNHNRHSHSFLTMNAYVSILAWAMQPLMGSLLPLLGFYNGLQCSYDPYLLNLIVVHGISFVCTYHVVNVRSLHSSRIEVLRCHLCSNGKLLASSGHEKKAMGSPIFELSVETADI